jgi:hypothetical protein
MDSGCLDSGIMDSGCMISLISSRDAHDQVESGVSERRNESAFKARVFGSATSGERVANKKLVNIMLCLFPSKVE